LVLCAAYAVCAVATEPDIIATIARAMPILRIRFLPGVCEIAMQTVHRTASAFEAICEMRVKDSPNFGTAPLINPGPIIATIFHDWMAPDIRYTELCPGLPVAPDNGTR
jgi:hypothetical protein